MTSPERMFALYKGIEYVVQNKIPGDIVECGVWKGGSSMLAAMTCLVFGERARKIYLYDTYSGMAEPTEDDRQNTKHNERARTKWDSLKRKDGNDWCFASLEEVERNMNATGYPTDQLVFVKGRVEETLPQIKPDQIALLRLDTDWYASTKHELKHLYPLLSQNGLLLIDDYGHWAGAKKAVDEFFDVHPIYLARIDNTARVGIKTNLHENDKPY